MPTMQQAYLRHLSLAEENYVAYQATQERVSKYEAKALRAQGGHKPLQSATLKSDQAYKELTGDRDRYQSLAQFHATMALMYK